MTVFAERLKELRLKKGLSQEQLGQVIGVKKYSVYTYEKGRSEPNISGLIALADFFDVTVDYLIGHTNELELNQ